MTLAWLTCVVLGLDVAPPRPIAAECRGDGDCLISTFAGCCGSCCGVPPFAVSRESDRASHQRCAIVDCAAPRCSDLACEKTEAASAFRAACQQGRCTAVRVKAHPNACSSDADCRLEYISRPSRGDCGECGCCPGVYPIAVSVNEPQHLPAPAPPSRPRPLTKKEGASKPPPFGLSPGNGTASSPQQPPPTPPNCSPCPGPPLARAVCSGGHCAIAQPEPMRE